MSERERQELITHYHELAATCEALGFRQAALAWRYRAKRLESRLDVRLKEAV